MGVYLRFSNPTQRVNIETKKKSVFLSFLSHSEHKTRHKPAKSQNGSEHYSANWMNESDSDFNSPCIDRLAFWNTLTQNSENKKNSKKKIPANLPHLRGKLPNGVG